MQKKNNSRSTFQISFQTVQKQTISFFRPKHNICYSIAMLSKEGISCQKRKQVNRSYVE